MLPHEFKYGKNEYFIKVFILSYLKFLDDSPLDSLKPLIVYKRFLKELTTNHIAVSIKKFASLADNILSNEFATGSDSSTRVYLPAMKKTPIFKEYLSWLKTGSPETLKYILSFLRFGKKLAYIDPEFNTTAFRGWTQVEDGLRNLVFDDKDTATLRTIVKELIGPLLVDTLLPKFGTGKVSERNISDVYDKLERLSSHPRLDYAFRRERPFRGREEGFGSQRVNTSGVSSDVSRLKFVPKDITKSRSICMEPNAFMFYQQEVLRWMRRSFDRSIISRFVKLEDQSLSQRAAIHGSQFLSTDTIDLSSASDSVHAELVKRIFPPDWLFYMFATRTFRVLLPDGTIRAVEKFAPMGSAVCFPTQCIIFTAVCIYAYLQLTHGKTTGAKIFSRDDVVQLLDNIYPTRSAHTPFRKRLEPPVVYGDDIAVDSRSTKYVIALLSRLGFSVNVDKSFMGSSSFRESCGVYAWEGHDVTPVLYRLPFFTDGKMDSKVYASFIGAINTFQENGYSHVASFLLSVLKSRRFKYRLPFVTDRNAFGIFTLNKHKVPEESLRWNSDYQVHEEYVLGIGPRKPKKSRPNNLDEYRLDQWWRSRAVSSSPFSFGRGLTVRPQETRLVPTWARYEQ
jgi:hypothetical protein